MKADYFAQKNLGYFTLHTGGASGLTLHGKILSSHVFRVSPPFYVVVISSASLRLTPSFLLTPPLSPFSVLVTSEWWLVVMLVEHGVIAEVWGLSAALPCRWCQAFSPTMSPIVAQAGQFFFPSPRCWWVECSMLHHAKSASPSPASSCSSLPLVWSKVSEKLTPPMVAPVMSCTASLLGFSVLMDPCLVYYFHLHLILFCFVMCQFVPSCMFLVVRWCRSSLFVCCCCSCPRHTYLVDSFCCSRVYCSSYYRFYGDGCWFCASLVDVSAWACLFPYLFFCRWCQGVAVLLSLKHSLL